MNRYVLGDLGNLFGLRRLALAMLVKNESHPKFIKSLESIAPWINYWVIHDLGSTNGTQDLIKKFFQDKGIPGRLVESSWVNSWINRTMLMKDVCSLANIDYALIMDGDEKLIVSDPLFKHKLTSDAYQIPLCNEGMTAMKLVNTNLNWRYEGVTHTYLTTNHIPRYIVKTNMIRLEFTYI